MDVEFARGDVYRYYDVDHNSIRTFSRPSPKVRGLTPTSWASPMNGSGMRPRLPFPKASFYPPTMPSCGPSNSGCDGLTGCGFGRRYDALVVRQLQTSVLTLQATKTVEGA